MRRQSATSTCLGVGGHRKTPIGEENKEFYMFHLNSAKMRKHGASIEAQALLDAAIASGKDLQGDGLKKYQTLIAEIKDLDARIARHEAGLPQLDAAAIPGPFIFGENGNGNKPALFGRTEDGREIPIFGEGESIAAHLKRERNEPPNVSFGELMKAMVLGGGSRDIRAALSIGTDSAGGFTVPEILSGQLIDRLRARSVMSQAGARTVLLDGGKSTTLASIVADPVAGWRAEGSDVATSDMTFGAVSFVPKSLAVIVTANRELIEDSLNLDEALTIAFAGALGGELDRVSLMGSGTGSEPTGVSKTAGVGSFSMGTNGAALDDYSRLWKPSTFCRRRMLKTRQRSSLLRVRTRKPGCSRILRGNHCGGLSPFRTCRFWSRPNCPSMKLRVHPTRPPAL